jgi:hypothetical protein
MVGASGYLNFITRDNATGEWIQEDVALPDGSFGSAPPKYIQPTINPNYRLLLTVNDSQGVSTTCQFKDSPRTQYGARKSAKRRKHGCVCDFCPFFTFIVTRQKGNNFRPRISFCFIKISHSPPFRAWIFLRRMDFFRSWHVFVF